MKQFVVLRTEADQRSAWLRWSPIDGAYAYSIYFGLASDKRYSCIMVHSANNYTFKGMGTDWPCYLVIAARNENGVSDRLPVVLTK